jgi:hypothetical protein
MDHNEAVLQHATERYLLNELDREQRDQFEEHYFSCPECALDVRAGTMFVVQSKKVFATWDAEKQGWFARLWAKFSEFVSAGSWRPAFAVPVMATLLTIVGYQNLVTVPELKMAANTPQVLPWASVNISTRGSDPTRVPASPGQGFNLLVTLPHQSDYASYRIDLYNAAGKLELTRTIPAGSAENTRSIYIPGADRKDTYRLEVVGLAADGKATTLPGSPVLQLQN